MSRVDDRPWFKFRPDRWLGDVGLQSCSLSAQGLWINLVALMHQSKEYGHLTYKGRPATTNDIAKMLPRLTPAVIDSCLQELADEDVFSRRESDNCIYSRRMVDDFIRSSAGQEFAQKGKQNEEDNTPLGKPKATPMGELEGHKNKNKNKNKRERKSPREARGTPTRGRSADGEIAAFIAPDFMPDDKWISDKANKLGLEIWEVRAAVIESREYWRSQTTQKARKTPRGWLQAMNHPLSSVVANPNMRAKLKLFREDSPVRSRHAKIAAAAALPDWFLDIKSRIKDSVHDKSWDELWSKCEPIEGAAPGKPVVTLRSHSNSFYADVTNNRTRDAERFFQATGYTVKLLPPEPTQSR